MTLTTILLITALIERITEGINSIKFFKEKVDARITAVVIGIALAFLLQINLFVLSGFLSGLLAAIPAWALIAVSGYIMSMGAGAVNWVWNQVDVNKNTTEKNIKDKEAIPS
jgi:uncharacterized membrane protein (DUF485 family)